MKRLIGIVAIVALVLSCLGFTVQPSVQALNLNTISLQSSSVLGAMNAADEKLSSEFGQKLDLNNSDIRDFRDLRGFYPNLASKIIQNAPYESVEEVLNIPNLSDRQKERLQANLDNFTVTDPASVFNEGDDRFNPGVY